MVDNGQRYVRVQRGVAVPGKVLCARRHTCRLQASDPGCTVPRYTFGVVTKTADADNGIVEPGVDVDAGSEVQGAACPAQRPADRGRGSACGLEIVEPTQYSVARKRGTRSREEPRDVTAFLVYGDDRVRVLGQDCVGQVPQLSGRGNVLRVKADTSQTCSEPISQPDRQRRSREPGQQRGQQPRTPASSVCLGRSR